MEQLKCAHTQTNCPTQAYIAYTQRNCLKREQKQSTSLAKRCPDNQQWQPELSSALTSKQKSGKRGREKKGKGLFLIILRASKQIRRFFSLFVGDNIETDKRIVGRRRKRKMRRATRERELERDGDGGTWDRE